ncbi:AAA family ATPase [Phyllobacterium sp. YR531]|uniref:AAA family ATPase n=1 Tax=Phyllobacterium sp. YR531 TaxID=1144343 RepID=UPI00026F5AD2|nr:AAA family ATPase [Phyllobacterium sp. YR531]EJN06567.1 shikimate kinase [Phyllobacterium sp. YR531]
MNHILLTGMSATGKSAIVRELITRGYRAVDLDTPEWSEWVNVDSADVLTPAEGKDWVWREDRVRALLSEDHNDILFISGCAENMENLYPLIDKIILLSTPLELVMQRLKARSSDSYGSTDAERNKISELVATVEPMLRQAAHHEIDTSGPLKVTVDEILKLASEPMAS